MTPVKPPIVPAIVRGEITARSKKHTLETISGVLAEAAGTLNPAEVFEALIVRERLGCTALGNGVALPHGRADNIQQSVAVFARLSEAVGFDAPDGEPVDLIFAVLVPTECEAGEIEKIARLAHWFGDPAHREACRIAGSEAELKALLVPADIEPIPAAAERRAS